MKNILMAIPTLRMGGAEKSIVSLIKSLDPEKVKVDLFLFEAGGVLQRDIPEWVNVLEADFVTRAMILEMSNYFGDLLKNFKLGAAFSRIRISVNSFLSSKLGRKPKFSWNIIKKHIPELTKHYDVAVGYLEGFTDFFIIDKVNADRKVGWIHSDMSGRKIFSEDIEYYNSFDGLATISDVCLDAACKAFPGIENKIKVIENIVLPDEVINKSKENVNSNWDESCTNIISVGRLEYAKGMDIGAHACKILKNKGLSFCWHIYGKGTMHEEIEAFIKENELENEFILEGVTPNPYPYISKADIFVQPSRWEGKSIALDEAKILGKAIVVTNYPSVSDQITNEVTGLITECTPEAIADGIERVINDNDLRKKLESNCSNEPNQSEKAVNKFYEMIEV